MYNGALGSSSHGGQKLDRDDTIIDGRFLDIRDRRGDVHMLYCSSCS